MMTSTQIRQSFLDFFKSKQHTIVPSSSLMPDAPNLLFTNAGMNQFVPIFLGQTKCPYTPGRAADTQKCIRAGGKHNDLEDVGLDTYHHTFFEMLGNWSFGDYFKKEAIECAWELVVNVWKFPPQRLYATVYCPDEAKPHWNQLMKLTFAKAKDRDVKEWGQNDYQDSFFGPDRPLEKLGFKENPDFEAAYWWAELFIQAGLDPMEHVVAGNRKDNFWMMGETGPCGPCSELNVDLTPNGDTRGSLVNRGDARCIEIWNLVFIQFNANPDGSLTRLPARHVDTGMGFERVTSIIQGTRGLQDFADAKISNYETDIFRPIFDALEKLSGKKYGSTLPGTGQASLTKECGQWNSSVPIPLSSAAFPTEQVQLDIAFRVIADHIRTLSFAIADGIEPGIKGRNGVLRSIHKRMVRYASTIGVEGEILLRTQDALVETLATIMGDIFPEVRAQKEQIKKVLRREADVFNKTLANGIKRFNQICGALIATSLTSGISNLNDYIKGIISDIRFLKEHDPQNFGELVKSAKKHDASWTVAKLGPIPGDFAFELYDTYGFPLDLTELMARERGLTVDKAGFDKLMDEQKARARAAQKKEVISLSEIGSVQTQFVGYEHLESDCRVLKTLQAPEGLLAVVDKSPLYAEMGGQVGDTGLLILQGQNLKVLNTVKQGQAFLLKLEYTDEEPWLPIGDAPQARLKVDKSRRDAIQRHHTVTHLLHWALHEVVSRDASQKGSFVGPDKLTFDFNSGPLTPDQVAKIEHLVNEKILENEPVYYVPDVSYADVKSRKDVMQFFGDKYGDIVRVVQIGGHAAKLDGYSMELCGGTHTRATGEIGLFRIVGENAIASGVRRIEAIAGLEAYRKATDELALIKSIAGKVNSPVHELENKIAAMLEQQRELEKALKAAQQREASNAASLLLEEIKTVNGVPAIIHNLGAVDGDFLQLVADVLKSQFKGVIVLGGGPQRGSVALVAAVTPEFTSKVQAGKIIQTIAPIVGGKGGGKPDNARGGGKDASKLDEALAKAKTLL